VRRPLSGYLVRIGRNGWPPSRQYARHIPVTVISHMPGVLEADSDQFIKWIHEILELGIADDMVLGGGATVNSALAQGLRNGMPRLTKLALLTVPATRRSARCAISLPACVPKPKTAKS